MRTVSIDALIKELGQIPSENFVCGTIYKFLLENPVDVASLEPYLFFNENFYTRNLIFKNELFEVLALCWESGQASQIHDHADQNCWMTMPLGKLQIKNFRVVEQDLATRFCRVEETAVFDLKPDSPAEVELEEPLHQVLNLPDFKERAVSLHVYSKPFDSCNVYLPDKNEIRSRKMCYTSMYGKFVS